MKGKINLGITILMALLITAGLSLLLYPWFSNLWNQWHQSRAVAYYQETVTELDRTMYERMLEEARAYNRTLPNLGARNLTADESARYQEVLNVNDSGIMGYVDIPKIHCHLPIYHGTAESVLQIAVGHLEWTSLPVGGEGTHTVLSGHTGLPSASLFTDLDQLEEGDTFTLTVLDEVLTYQVDQIRVVLPQETQDLKQVKGKDYCTLMTCTPYGINDHRLLVRGSRIETPVKAVPEVTDSKDVLRYLPLLLKLLFLMILVTAALRILGYFRRSRADGEIYRQMAEMAVAVNPDPDDSENVGPSRETPDSDDPSQNSSCPIAVDFTTLQMQYPGIVGWLYCEGTEINYPIMGSSDNREYLKMGPDGKKNSCGSLFLDCQNSLDFTDPVSIVYGHNMKNGSMFGMLDRYSQPGTYNRHPVFWLLTPEGSMRIDLAAGCVTDETDEVYDRKDLKSVWDLALRSEFYSMVTWSEEDRFLVMSTCAYEFEGARYILLGKIAE